MTKEEFTLKSETLASSAYELSTLQQQINCRLNKVIKAKEKLYNEYCPFKKGMIIKTNFKAPKYPYGKIRDVMMCGGLGSHKVLIYFDFLYDNLKKTKESTTYAIDLYNFPNGDNTIEILEDETIQNA